MAIQIGQSLNFIKISVWFFQHVWYSFMYSKSALIEIIIIRCLELNLVNNNVKFGPWSKWKLGRSSICVESTANLQDETEAQFGQS